jgi:hypothetical protein
LADPADPKPGAYRPFVSARRPGSPPDSKPRFRVLVHRQYLDLWNQLVDRVGEQNAQQVWDHVAHTPDRFPSVGSSSVMKGKYAQPKWEGYSRTIHYEITGAGRIDYQYCADSQEGSQGDPHGVVKILTIDLSSH